MRRGGLAFDSVGNLFVAEIIPGDILKITPGGNQSVFASAIGDLGGNGGPEFLRSSRSHQGLARPFATRRTAIWYLNNNVYVGGAYGPILPAGWSLVAP
jgi:hypothetical protein